MKIINIMPEENAQYTPIQDAELIMCPDGCAIVPDDLDTSAFYEYDGFVTLDIVEGIVTAMMPNVEAWKKWLDEHPAPEPTPDEPEPTPAPTVWDEIAAAYQEGVNSAYD